MSIATSSEMGVLEQHGDQCVVLRDIDWTGYSSLLRLRGERPDPRIVYLDGSLLLLSPSLHHEWLKERSGLLFMVLVEELDIPCIVAGSTTLRRRSRCGGVEGDQTYYLSHLDRIRGKKKINLKKDPPPDLAIEAVVTQEADEAIEVYRRLRVPELWVCDPDTMIILVLQPDDHYAPSERSQALKVISAQEIHSWVTRSQDMSDTAWIKELRRWVIEVILPRHRALKAE
jgi:Uma2 family endonuclease